MCSWGSCAITNCTVLLHRLHTPSNKSTALISERQAYSCATRRHERRGAETQAEVTGGTHFAPLLGGEMDCGGWRVGVGPVFPSGLPWNVRRSKARQRAPSVLLPPTAPRRLTA